jgi:heme ABC exporter ATP-binding subunit CcmA
MEPVVHLRAAVSVLGRHPALAGVDLDVEQGEIVALRGPNGAGKSTLLRLCAGLVELADGHGRVLGCNLATERVAVRPRVGLLGHDSPLYDDLSATENVRFWCRCAAVEPAQADDALTQLGVVGRLAEVPVSRLSAGQRRRAALAVLVARRPELWLLDEPHAGLDQAGRELLDGLVARAAAAGATVVLASHERERVATLGARVVEMVGGTVVPAATVEEVTARAR